MTELQAFLMGMTAIVGGTLLATSSFADGASRFGTHDPAAHRFLRSRGHHVLTWTAKDMLWGVVALGIALVVYAVALRFGLV